MVSPPSPEIDIASFIASFTAQSGKWCAPPCSAPPPEYRMMLARSSRSTFSGNRAHDERREAGVLSQQLSLVEAATLWLGLARDSKKATLTAVVWRARSHSSPMRSISFNDDCSICSSAGAASPKSRRCSISSR